MRQNNDLKVAATAQGNKNMQETQASATHATSVCHCNQDLNMTTCCWFGNADKHLAPLTGGHTRLAMLQTLPTIVPQTRGGRHCCYQARPCRSHARGTTCCPSQVLKGADASAAAQAANINTTPHDPGLNEQSPRLTR